MQQNLPPGLWYPMILHHADGALNAPSCPVSVADVAANKTTPMYYITNKKANLFELRLVKSASNVLWNLYHYSIIKRNLMSTFWAIIVIISLHAEKKAVEPLLVQPTIDGTLNIKIREGL